MRSFPIGRRSVTVAIATCALVVVSAGCSSSDDDASVGPEVESTVATDTVAPAPNEPLPSDPAPGDDLSAGVPELLRFTAPLVGGGTFDGTAAVGVPTVFWFWAPT